MKYFYFFAGLLLFVAGCDKGISPTVSKTGFSGKVYFMNAPDSTDQILDLRVVAVPYYPIDTSVNELISKILGGIIPFSSSLPLNVDSGFVANYELDVPAKDYHYIAVVQQFGINITHDWRVLSFYGFDSTSFVPKAVTVQSGEFLSNINMTVDFRHLPPQPFVQ
jgi:hypothetical protein